MNANISNYVEAFFERFPYSRDCFIAKEKIIEALNKEYEKDGNFENIIAKYNNLEKMAILAGYSKNDIKTWKNSGEVLEVDEVKKGFKQQRKHIVISTILSILFVASFVNIFLIGLYNAVTTIVLALALIWRFKKKRVKNEIDICSINAFTYLKEKYDKYSKKLINGIFISFMFFIYLIISLIRSSINSKSFEILEFFNYNILLIEIVFYIIIKNFLMTKWIKNIIHDNKVNESGSHIKKIILFSSAYWMLVLIIEIIFQFKSYVGILIGTLIVYLIAMIIYTFGFRKRILYKNIVINKFKIISVVLIVVVVAGYQFMQRDFWLTQPYINTIPNIYEGDIDVSYNEENGVYTITNHKDEFKILQLTDIHLGGSPFSYTKDMKALRTTYEMLEYTKPDFVVITGDLTFPMGIMSLSLNNYAPVMQFASFMRNAGVPWAFTYGNHDTESIAKYTKEDLNSLYKNLSYKTSKTLLYPYTQPDITGRNNQMIEIRNSDGSLNQALFLIDSNAYTGEGINKYDYIRDEQVEWYKNCILDLQEKEGKEISSLGFFHIPLQEYATAYKLYEEKSDEVKYYFGENNEKMINKVCASEYPSKLFDTAVELGSTKGFFCGHDHYNNMSLEYRGIRLTYGMSIDYLAMPGIENDTEQRGATLIKVHNDSSIDIEQIPYSKISK